MWSTVAELTGCNGMPATERGCRKYLDNLAAKVPDVRRKRVGTKAFEYHIDFCLLALRRKLKIVITTLCFQKRQYLQK